MTERSAPPGLAGQDLQRRDPRPGDTGKRLLAADQLAFAPDSYDAAAGTVDVVWSTGAAVTRYDWWSGEYYAEELDLAGADLARLNAGAALLMDHWASVETLIGSVVPDSARIAGGNGVATVRFDRSSPEGQAVEGKVAGGHLRFVSIGYRVTTWEKIETTGQMTRWIARAWQPFEISFVPVPADAGAGTRGERGAESPAPTPPSTTRPAAGHIPEVRMADEVKPGAPAAPKPDDAQVEAQRAAAVKEAREAELARAKEIRAAGAALGLATFAEALVAAGDDLPAAQRKLIEEVARVRAESGTPNTAHTKILRDGDETKHRGIEGWLMHRMAPRLYKLEGPALDCRGMTLLDIARHCLEAGGHRTRGLTPSEIARAALGLPVNGSTFRGGGTTSDFPNLLANAQSKRLLAAYDGEDRNYQSWARRRDLPDFKIARSIELGAAPTLKALQEGGNIEYGVMGEGGEQWNLVRYARNTSLSYPAIVNDDLGGFDRIGVGFANAAANLELSTVYGIIAANPTMADGTALFASTRTVTVDTTTFTQSNTTTGALTTDNFQALRTLLLRVRDATGQQTRTMPNVLIVPPEIEMTALALFSTVVVPAGVATTQVNPYRGQVEVVSTQFLTDNNDWFLTVSAGTGYEAVEYGYETGSNGPDLTSYTDPEVDGMSFSCRHSFGAKAVTWRTIGRSAN